MPRPFGVTLVGILVIIAGISYVISGIVGIFNADLRASVSRVRVWREALGDSCVLDFPSA